MKTAERIGFLRRELKLTQAELAKLLSTDGNTVSRWERGKLGIKISTLYKLAAVLNTSVAYLIGEIDDPMVEALSIPSERIAFAKNNVVGSNVNFGDSDNINMNVQNIVISVGDVRMEFPATTPGGVIAQAIKSAKGM